MSIKMAVAVTLLMVGPVLSWVGYKPGGSGITPEAGEHLRALFALGPAAIYLLSALVFSRYPITRENPSSNARPPGRPQRRRRTRKSKSHRVASVHPWKGSLTARRDRFNPAPDLESYFIMREIEQMVHLRIFRVRE